MRWKVPAKRPQWGWGLLGLALFSLGAITSTWGAVPERTVLRPLNAPDGRKVELSAPKGGASALIFYSSECPISNAYSPTLNRLVEEFPAASFRLVGVCVD